MLFKNIASWSKNKCKWVEFSLNLLQLVFSMIIPIIIVGVKYGLFQKAEGWKLTTSGLIVVIIVALSTINYFIQQVKKLPEASMNERKVKYTLTGLGKIVVPAIVIVVLKIIKRNVETGVFVVSWCMASYIVAIAIQYLFTEYVTHELEIYDEATHQNEVQKKMANLK